MFTWELPPDTNPGLRFWIAEVSKNFHSNRLTGSPGSSESPKEVEPMETHTKAHHNYTTQG